MSECTVVDVEDTLPQYLFQREAVGSVLIDVVVEQSGNHVVGRGDRMEVASEVEVDLVHRQHLSVTATGSTAFLTEAGTERRLTQCHDSILADGIHAERQTHAYRRLADAGLGGTDSGHEDEVVLAHGFFLDGVDVHLGDVLTIAFSLLRVDTQLPDDVVDRTENCRLCNFNIRFHLSTIKRLIYGCPRRGFPVFYMQSYSFFLFFIHY